MSSLISENRGLVTRLERGAKLLHAQSSSVEEEVLAVEQVRYEQRYQKQEVIMMG